MPTKIFFEKDERSMLQDFLKSILNYQKTVKKEVFKRKEIFLSKKKKAEKHADMNEVTQKAQICD